MDKHFGRKGMWFALGVLALVFLCILACGATAAVLAPRPAGTWIQAPAGEDGAAPPAVVYHTHGGWGALGLLGAGLGLLFKLAFFGLLLVLVLRLLRRFFWAGGHTCPPRWHAYPPPWYGPWQGAPQGAPEGEEEGFTEGSGWGPSSWKRHAWRHHRHHHPWGPPPWWGGRPQAGPVAGGEAGPVAGGEAGPVAGGEAGPATSGRAGDEETDAPDSEYTGPME